MENIWQKNFDHTIKPCKSYSLDSNFILDFKVAKTSEMFIALKTYILFLYNTVPNV